jgi:hypothetical protein
MDFGLYAAMIIESKNHLLKSSPKQFIDRPSEISLVRTPLLSTPHHIRPTVTRANNNDGAIIVYRLYTYIHVHTLLAQT